MSNMDEMPPITISSIDYDQLDRIAVAGMRSRRDPGIAQSLADELSRATIVPPEQVAPNIVTMNSCVTFRDDLTEVVRSVTLVYPGEEDIASGRISILTPVGTALIGVAEGQSIGWRSAGGDPRALTVLKVHSQFGAALSAKMSPKGPGEPR
jgi:regulator of nucleoside diphosphate kinase